jgi:hypothetical protein
MLSLFNLHFHFDVGFFLFLNRNQDFLNILAAYSPQYTNGAPFNDQQWTTVRIPLTDLNLPGALGNAVLFSIFDIQQSAVKVFEI